MATSKSTKPIKRDDSEVSASTRLLRDIRDDPVYLKFKAVVIAVQTDTSPEKTRDEAMTLMRTRISRTLMGKRPSAEKLQDCSMQEMSFRSRLTELRAQLFVHNDILTRALAGTRSHIISSYAGPMRSIHSNEGERKAFLSKVLNKGLELQSEIESAAATIDMFITDIDKGGYNLRNSIDLLKILLGRPGQDSV